MSRRIWVKMKFHKIGRMERIIDKRLDKINQFFMDLPVKECCLNDMALSKNKINDGNDITI